MRPGEASNPGASNLQAPLTIYQRSNPVANSYNGNLNVGGSVSSMTTSGTSQTFTYAFTGVDPQCASGAGNAANSCGIHIHQGTDCTSDAAGHYYTGTVTADPWTNVAYRVTGTTASGSETVNTGATNAEVTGKAFIVHGYDGGRIACAVLRAAPSSSDPTAGPPMTAQNFVPYFVRTRGPGDSNPPAPRQG